QELAPLLWPSLPDVSLGHPAGLPGFRMRIATTGPWRGSWSRQPAPARAGLSSACSWSFPFANRQSSRSRWSRTHGPLLQTNCPFHGRQLVYLVNVNWPLTCCGNPVVIFRHAHLDKEGSPMSIPVTEVENDGVIEIRDPEIDVPEVMRQIRQNM